MAAQDGEIILVTMADLFDEAMGMQAGQDARDLPRRFIREERPQGFVGKATDANRTLLNDYC